ncbi:MAG: globin family protein, partial [Spirulina sp.]
FEKIKPKADEFVSSFYENLFTANPEAKPLFGSTDMAAQKKKLLGSLVLVVENLRKPEVLSEALKGLGARHVEYGALPEHYPLVGNALLTTFAQYLSEDWTEEVKQAWVKAYGVITELMLEGADYSAKEVELKEPSSTPEPAPTPEPTPTPESTSAPEPAPEPQESFVVESEINWSLFGGVFVGAGVLVALLLLL